MNQDIKTLELAKIYESQNCFNEAFEIYSVLDTLETSHEIKAGLKRMEQRMKDQAKPGLPEETISRLFEKWVLLMVLKQRFDNFKKIKKRLL